MKNEISIAVTARLSVPEETARICFNMLKIYCYEIRGDFEPSLDNCSGCVCWTRCPLLRDMKEEG